MDRKTCDLEIITYNVRGLGDFSKRKDIFDFLRSHSADIICLQEVHVTPGKENVFKNQWGGKAWFSPVSSVAGGVGILVQNKIACKLIDVSTNGKGNAIFLTLKINEVVIKIGNIYGPPDCDDPGFFDEVFRMAFSDQQENLILCGDWNFSMSTDVDQYNYAARDRRARSRELVTKKCLDLNLYDVWRLMNGEKRQFSWRKRNPVKCARLDFFLVSDSILNKSLSCEILPAYRSDHSRVSLRLNLSDQSRGRGLWKFNCSLLKDLTYHELVKNAIQETIFSYICPVYSFNYMKSQESRKDMKMTIEDDLFLETLLMTIRSETIKYAIKKTREKGEREKSILLQLQELESLPAPTSEDLESIRQKQSELETLRSTANEGRIIRSRARWYEEGEKGSSAYFLKLERRNFESKLIPCLDIGNCEAKESSEILAALSEYYASLYSSDENFSNIELENYLKSAKLPKLSDIESQSLERAITVEELGRTLRKFSNNRSPGSDGFPYEFFKVFWIDIKHFVHRSLIYGLGKGELSITQREGLITLVPKPSKPRNLISSWRPITLLNSTYKILAGTVANRLKTVLNSIIHPDQTAFMKNRFIGENIRATHDVLWEAYSRNKEGLLLSVDFRTAFDVMNWRFLGNCLNKFNFGKRFIEIFWCLHKHTFSRIVYNGHLSKQNIHLNRGCRQGDPVSCYFFIIGAEVLANKIRENEKIHGIHLEETAIKVIQYADDTTFFLDGSERSLRATFDELGWFAKYSGLKPNISKSHAMWIGKKAFSSERICPDITLNWVEKIKLLGVLFSPQCKNIVDKNIKLKKDAILRTIAAWQSRNLTLVGRITVAKSLLLSQLTHVISSLPDPSDKFIKEVNKILFTFVWNSKRSPLKRIRLCQHIGGSGLAMLDFATYVRSLKMKWIKRLIIGNGGSWSALVPKEIRGEFIWNYGKVALKKVLNETRNPFWRDVIAAWIYFSKGFVIPDECICDENIFNSDYTKFKSSSYASWEKKGVRVVGDLFDGNQLLTWEGFKNRYNIPCNYLEYYGLIRSLPRALQQDQPNTWIHHQPSISARLSFLLRTASFTRILTTMMTNNYAGVQRDMDRIERKWMRDIGHFEPQSVQEVKNSISATRYTSFQYKLVMRILTTNNFLHLINYMENDRCTFCDRFPETLLHLFFSCQFVQRYWNDLLRYASANGLGHICDKDKFFGDTESNLKTHYVTLAKYVIYENRRRGTRPSFSEFREYLKRDFQTERLIAANKNENYVQTFNKKWRPLMENLETS